jgi:hypothetical protein
MCFSKTNTILNLRPALKRANRAFRGTRSHEETTDDTEFALIDAAHAYFWADLGSSPVAISQKGGTRTHGLPRETQKAQEQG